MPRKSCMFELNRNLKLLLVLNVASSLNWGLVSPLLPLFLNDLQTDIVQIGWVLFLGNIVATVCMIPSGILSDRYRRRNLLILGSSVSLLGCISLATIRNWEQSILGFALFSSALSIFMPSLMTMVADNAESGSLATLYGVMNTSWLAGMASGPVIGGLIADNFGWTVNFYLATILSAFSLFPSLLFKRTYKGDKREDKKKIGSKFFTRDTIALLAKFSMSQCFLSVGIGIMEMVVPLYLANNFFLDETTVGFFLSMGMLATLIAQIISGVLADRHGIGRILTLSLVPLPLVALFWLWIGNYIPLMIVHMSVFGLWGMTWPVATAFLMRLAPTLERGSTLSINETAARLGFTIGPLLGGYFWFILGAGTTFIASAVFFALSLFLVVIIRK